VPILSDVAIANLARGAGFRDDRPSNDRNTKNSELATAVAIALAESGGNPNAYNASPAYGLWQIHPGDSSLFDPANNARAAWGKYSGAGNSFSPWTTFNQRTYVPFVPRGNVAAASTTPPGFTSRWINGALRDLPLGFLGGAFAPAIAAGGSVLGSVSHAFTGEWAKDLATFLSFITSPELWLRVGEAIGGAILLLFALWLLFSQTRTGERMNAAAGSVAKGVVAA
jgi:hypothetical protein